MRSQAVRIVAVHAGADILAGGSRAEADAIFLEASALAAVARILVC